jgi:ribosome-binding factor A
MGGRMPYNSVRDDNMPTHRMDRLNEDIMREITDILRSVKDPRISGLISVVKVTVTPDLSYAKVFVSDIGGDVKESVKGLSSAAGYVRSELASRIKIRKTPQIKFIPDDSIEESARISKLLNDLTKGE